MKTLELVETQAISGGHRFGFNAIQDPIIQIDGPVITDPAPPVGEVVLQRVVALKMAMFITG